MEKAVKENPALYHRGRQQAVAQPPPQPAARARLPDGTAAANGRIHRGRRGKRRKPTSSPSKM